VHHVLRARRGDEAGDVVGLGQTLSVQNVLAVENAERNLKGLRTRLDVLETNLKKYNAEPEGEIA